MKSYPLALRLTLEDRRQLSALMEVWGETQSDAIRRAIALAFQTTIIGDTMRKCAVCKQREAIYLMQFIADDKPSFYLPGYHIRGFATIPVCDVCKDEAIARTQPQTEPHKTEPGA